MLFRTWQKITKNSSRLISLFGITVLVGAALLIGCTTSAPTNNTSNYKLTVSIVGAGTITSSPESINCGNTCSAEFLADNSVTLIATPSQGAYFAAWDGCDSDSETCTITMSTAKSVTANFRAEPKGFNPEPLAKNSNIF